MYYFYLKFVFYYADNIMCVCVPAPNSQSTTETRRATQLHDPQLMRRARGGLFHAVRFSHFFPEYNDIRDNK